MTDVLVRSAWWATRVPGAEAPFDTVHLKVHYPAVFTDTMAERMSGVMAADPSAAPYPVVVFVPGVNIGQDAYRWLAIEAARNGFVGVTFDHVGELFPGMYGISPGVELDAVRPESYGSRSTSPVLGAILDGLRDFDARGPIAGALDLDRVALFGHSGGGSVALQSGATRFYPSVRAVVAYAAHLQPATVLGWEPGDLLESPVDVPVLLMAGTEDGVMGASAVRYGQDAGSRRDPVERTYDESFVSSPDTTYVLFKGANHFAVGNPEDPTSARGFLDGEATTDPSRTRAVLVDVVTHFLRAHLRDDATSRSALDSFATTPPVEVETVRRRQV